MPLSVFDMGDSERFKLPLELSPLLRVGFAYSLFDYLLHQAGELAIGFKPDQSEGMPEYFSRLHDFVRGIFLSGQP